MKLINSAIIGSGISAFACSQAKPRSKVLYTDKKITIKKHKFYELNAFGGNTNVWGAYVNLFRLNKFKLKNKKFKKFIETNKFFEIKKLTKNNQFRSVGYLSEKKKNIPFRLNKNHFKNSNNFEIERIKIFKKFVELNSNNYKKIKCKELNLCVGNISLINLLFKSNLINKEDVISFEDGKIGYSFKKNFSKNKNYYIPMTIIQIIKKLFFISYTYSENEMYERSLLQISENKYHAYKVRVIDLLNSSENLYRGFNSNHITNIKINNQTIKNFIKKKTKRVKVFCTGTINKYLSGSISQDLIYNAYCQKF